VGDTDAARLNGLLQKLSVAASDNDRKEVIPIDIPKCLEDGAAYSVQLHLLMRCPERQSDMEHCSVSPSS
jgi:hypothetical protein